GRDELNAEIASVHQHFVYDQGCPPEPGAAGKLSMGVGGVNACVVSRPFDAAPAGEPESGDD
ncbi:MAG: hypothetical protein MI919_20550, partial [Holophagales bacterium]|nr:hypothetical protein [Holophagales bacterium]